MDLSAIICDRWEIPLRLPQTGKQPWFMDWVVRRPHEVSGHLTAGYCAYRSLQLVWENDAPATAWEYFGGMGAQSVMINGMFRPQEHTVIDRSPEAVAHLVSAVPSLTQVVCADSYAYEAPPIGSLVGLDFGDLTAWKLRQNEPHRVLLDRVFWSAPRAVVLTDVAGPRLHLHTERYADILCRSFRSYAGYLEALSAWVRERYRYTLVRGYYQHWSAVLAFVPKDHFTHVGALDPVPSEPWGLVIK